MDLREDVIEDNGREDLREWALLGEAFLDGDGAPGAVSYLRVDGASFCVNEFKPGQGGGRERFGQFCKGYYSR